MGSLIFHEFPLNVGLATSENFEAHMIHWLQGVYMESGQADLLIESLAEEENKSDLVLLFHFLALIYMAPQHIKEQRDLFFSLLPNLSEDVLPSVVLQICRSLLFGAKIELSLPLPPMAELSAVENAQLGILLGLCALEDDSIRPHFYERVHLQSKLIDHNCLPLRSLWIKERKFSPHELFINNSTLFYMAGLFTGNVRWKSIADRHAHSLSQLPKKPLPILPILARKVISGAMLPPPIPIVEKGDFHAFPALVKKESAQTACMTLLGNHSALGAFHKDNVHVHAFGPHEAPLGQSRNFGISRTSTFDYSDMKVQSREGYLSLKGWTRSHSDHAGEQKWIYADMTYQGGEWAIQLQSDGQPPAYFVFFVSSKLLIIDGLRYLYPSTLEHFKGDARKLLFQDEREQICIETKEPARVEVIPLAGSEAYYGAHFLVAYPLSSSRMTWFCS